MGRIRVLDDQLINRIAAGEVVERPASVVKELVENSLDAGARRVDVTISGGGRRLVRVADDGYGMDRDDALLALERHATSKLRSRDDLEAIATLGFRGEAIPSIAAVSRFLIRTATDDGAGTEVEVRGGKILAVRDGGGARGTTVEVTSLFFNTPARRKFLRSEPTELSHVARLLTRFALTRPEVRFRLEHDGRILLEAPPAPDRRSRIEQVYGADFARGLLPFSLARPGISIDGFSGRPVDASSRRDSQHLFVNGRQVQDRVLSHALTEAFGNTVARDRHPAVFLFVELDPALVDVNVHPQKTEVRFARSSEVHDAVREAVASSLSAPAAVPRYGDLRPAAGAGPGSIAEATLRYLERSDPGPGSPALRPAPAPREAGIAPLLQAAERDEPGIPAARVSPIAQFRDSYILAEDAQGLLVVDQHAAHERVLFERYLAEAESDRVETQRLLFPLMVELPPDERLLVEEEAAELARLGFAVEPFGGGSIRIDAVPAIAAGLDPVALLRELLGTAAQVRAAASGVAELRLKLVTTAACRAAIKIHHPLTRDGMQRLLDDLFRAANPTTCPHGRPILFRWTLEEIERTFRRR